MYPKREQCSLGWESSYLSRYLTISVYVVVNCYLTCSVRLYPLEICQPLSAYSKEERGCILVPLNFILHFFAFIFRKTDYQDTYLMAPSARLWIVQNEHRIYTITLTVLWQVDGKGSWYMDFPLWKFPLLLQQMMLLTTSRVAEWLLSVQW